MDSATSSAMEAHRIRTAECASATIAEYLLSQVEDIRISVDGVPVPRADIRFSVGGKTYTLDEIICGRQPLS